MTGDCHVRFCESRGLQRPRPLAISTEELCIEMAAANALSNDHAYAVFKTVYKTTRATFEKRVAALKL